LNFSNQGTFVPKTFVLIYLLLYSSLCFSADFKSEGMDLTIETLSEQNDVIWGFDFLDEKKMIFTLRSGEIKTLNLDNNKIEEIKGAPKVWVRGQGGLLDIRLHPKDRRKIFITYSEPMKKGTATTSFAAADLDGNNLKNLKNIFSAEPDNNNAIHFGSRIEFDDQDHVFITVGDRNDRPSVQDKRTTLGKILRFKLDGSIPKDNPFYEINDVKKEIWSLGHRSPQGLAWNSEKSQLWESEMGPKGGDEINLIAKGENYGWPVVTYGREYSGPRIGEGFEKAGMQSPVVYWVPSISPSGIAFYEDDKLPNWKGNLFVGNLSGSHLRRLVLKSDKVVKQEELLNNLNIRIRNVRKGPDGWLYLSTDEGQIMRIKLKGKP
jgi:glucose/arabinose dehydrogenase